MNYRILTLLFVISGLAQGLKADPPRNIVYILADDHRFDFIGFKGKVPWLKMPNLDRLAREGVYAPNTYVTTSLCSPSRASILTGLFLGRVSNPPLLSGTARGLAGPAILRSGFYTHLLLAAECP